MKLIIGLGNPGKKYRNTRHNVGFSLIEELAADLKVKLKKEKTGLFSSAESSFGREEVVLAMPLTFMNLSGSALKALLKKYNIDSGSLLVVCDDLDLSLGKLRIRASGSSGGHRGLESIIGHLKEKNFARLRIGIGRPHEDADPSDYVLSSFGRDEHRCIKDALHKACQCCRMWAENGITQSMDIFNQRSEKK